MKIHVSDARLAPALVRALNETDCAAALTAAHTVDVFMPWLGSEHGDVAHASAELVFFVRAWELRSGGFEAEVT
jgi:hypothetical protein